MSGTITFNELPYDWRSPGTFVEVRPDYSNTAVADYPTRALLMVQMLSTGTAVAGVVQRVTRAADAVGLFGAGSVGAAMVAAFKAANPFSECHAVALADNGAGTQATYTITITGTATVAGVLALLIAGHRVAVPVATTDTPTTIAAAIVAAVAALPDLPVSAANSAGVVTLTAKHKGEVGNEINVRANWRMDDATPPGITVAIAAAVAGATNPNIATLISAVATEWYTDIVVPWTDATSLSALTTELARRYTATARLDAHGYVGFRGTFSALTTKGGSLNSPYLSAIGAKLAPQPGYVWAAALAGVAAQRLTDDPARQLRGLVLPEILPPAAADRFIETEADLLLRAGISTFTVAPDGSVALSRVITTYRTTVLGALDTAWLDIMVPKVLSRIRYDWTRHLALTYPRHKLAADGSVAGDMGGDGVVTPRRMRGSWGARYGLYEQRGWVEDGARMLAGSTFLIAAQDRSRMEAVQKVRIIGNLITLAAALEFEV